MLQLPAIHEGKNRRMNFRSIAFARGAKRFSRKELCCVCAAADYAKFIFSGLAPIVRKEPSLAFDVAGGRGAPPTQKGDRVAFLLSDAFLPEAEEARPGQCREGEVEGTLLDFSDSGDVERAFAVVEVIERQTMVVPVEKLRALEKY